MSKCSCDKAIEYEEALQAINEAGSVHAAQRIALNALRKYKATDTKLPTASDSGGNGTDSNS